MTTIPLVDTSSLVTLTPAASEKLLGLMQEKQLENHALRVFVAGGGCSGLQYGMTFDDETHPGDAEFEVNGLKVRVDAMSARYIQGANIDYQDSLMGGGFKIDNPNAVSACGCGSSFKPRDEEGYDDASAGGGCGSGGCGCGH
ncbi:MAG TPA: iron-sulfur cluster insertion protein ErpA [Herpetosiphonaceae bacterium]